MGKNAKYVMWALAAVAIVAVGFMLFRPAGGGGEGQGVVDVDATRMAELAAEGVRVIDVRTPGEFAMGRIPGAENVPMNEIEAAAQTWDKTEPVAIYCATGSRSISVVQYLEQLGFSTIYHYADGVVTWQGDLETGTNSATPAPTPAPSGGSQTQAGPVLYEFFTDS
jgi:rhodanese-related sulfurtransferase